MIKKHPASVFIEDLHCDRCGKVAEMISNTARHLYSCGTQECPIIENKTFYPRISFYSEAVTISSNLISNTITITRQPEQPDENLREG